MSTPNPPSGGPPLRALAMVLIAVAIVFAGLGAMSLSKSESSGSQTTVAQAPTSTVPVSRSAVPAATSAPVVTSTTTAESSPAAEAPAAPTTTAAPAPPPPPANSPAPVDKSVPVRVLNNSTIAGLAAKTGTQLTSGGWNVTETGNYPEGVVARTTVYYGTSPQEKAAAQAIAADLGVTAEPRFPGIADSPPGVIVIVTGN